MPDPLKDYLALVLSTTTEDNKAWALAASILPRNDARITDIHAILTTPTWGATARGAIIPLGNGWYLQVIDRTAYFMLLLSGGLNDREVQELRRQKPHDKWWTLAWPARTMPRKALRELPESLLSKAYTFNSSGRPRGR